MADNIAVTAGSGTTIAADDVGSGVLVQRVKATWGPDGTANDTDVASGKPLPVQLRSSGGTEITVGTAGTPASSVSTVQGAAAMTPLSTRDRYFAVAATAITRPANTTAYAANDAVSDSATDASVTSQSFTVSDVNDDPVTLESLLLHSIDTGVAGKTFRAWFYQSNPTADSGIVGADNEAFSTKKGTFLGCMTGVFRTFSDGSVAELTPDNGRIITAPTSGAKTVFYLLQTLDAFTPSANSTTFTGTLRGFQGRV